MAAFSVGLRMKVGRVPLREFATALVVSLVAREESGYRWDRGTSWLERVIDFARKVGLGWGFLQFAIPI
jgi:hypothetical protein